MKIVYENPWFRVLKQDQYHYIEENGSDNGAIIIAKSNDKFLFVKVFRNAHQSYILELPRGYGDINETSLMAAIRELQEESGYTVMPECIQLIGTVKPNSSLLCSNIPVYFARILKGMKQDVTLMDTETSQVLFFDRKEVLELILNGEVSDGMSLSAIMLYFAKFECDRFLN